MGSQDISSVSVREYFQMEAELLGRMPSRRKWVPNIKGMIERLGIFNNLEICFSLFIKYPKYFIIENIIKQSKEHKMPEKKVTVKYQTN